MEPVLNIRPAGTADIPVIERLARRIWPSAYGDILTAAQVEYMLQQLYSPVSLTKQMQQQAHLFLLALLDEEPVGFAAYSALSDPAVYKLHKLYVRTDIQGMGLGRALVKEVATAAAAAGAGALQLNVNRHNTARRFYEKLGFTVIREEDIDIGNGFFMNDFVMEKKI